MESIAFESIVWLRPMPAEAGCKIHVRLRPGDGGSISFRIFNDADPNLVHAEGRARIEPAGNRQRVAAETGVSPGPNTLSGEDLYRRFARSGLEYGAGYRVIEELCYGEEEAMGRFRIPAGSGSEQALNSYLLDGALQAAAVLSSTGGEATMVPFSIARLRFAGSGSPDLVHVRRSSRKGNHEKFHVRILDREGTVLFDAEEFTIRASAPVSTPTYFRPQWERRDLPTSSNDDRGEGTLLLFGSSNGLDGELRAAWPDLEVVRVDDGGPDRATPETPASPLNGEAVFENLLDSKVPDYIIYCVSPMPDNPLGTFESLFPLSRALVRKGLKKQVTILCIGPDATDPAFLALAALGRTVTREQPLLRFKTLATGSVDASVLRELVA